MNRTQVPDWAREGNQAVSGVRMASEKQLNWIKSMCEQKDLTSLSQEQQAWCTQAVSNDSMWNPATTRITFEKAGSLIDTLRPLKFKPRDPMEQRDRNYQSADNAARFAVGVPAGRYAVTADSGELRFYNVWISRDKARLNVYVCHGPDESDLRYQQTVLGVLNKIKTAGIRESAIRYGLEIGECSNCGRRLTNRISRELGIGPICGGRMFGDDGWKDEVKAKRQEIIDRGQNPDEDI